MSSSLPCTRSPTFLGKFLWSKTFFTTTRNGITTAKRIQRLRRTGEGSGFSDPEQRFRNGVQGILAGCVILNP